MSQNLNIFLQGFLLQASLILALGAQNLFVLNSALQRQHHYLIAFVSTICDTALVFLGVLGVATFFLKFLILKISLGFVGVLFLAIYGLKKISEANNLRIQIENLPIVSLNQIIWTTLGFSLLNPHVYLDTVVLIGGYSAKFPELQERLYFGMGASTLSALWFFGLSAIAAVGGRFLNSPKAMRLVSLISGSILIGLSLKLGLEVYHWI